MNANTRDHQSDTHDTAPHPEQERAHSRAAGDRKPDTSAEIFGEPIYSYSRGQALEDGYLVDVTETAREAGFRVPVAITRAAWEDCVAWSEADTERKHWPQDEAGRLWDVLSMTRFYLKVATRRDPAADHCIVELVRVPRAGADCNARHVALVASIGPDDDGEPCITIGEPDDF